MIENNTHLKIHFWTYLGDQITPPDCKSPWRNFRRDFCIRIYSSTDYKIKFDSAQADCKEKDATLFEPRSVEGK